MARRNRPLMMEPEEVSPLDWAASGCGDTYTAGQRRHYYGSRSANVQSPGDRSATIHTPNRNPFKVRGAK